MLQRGRKINEKNKSEFGKGLTYCLGLFLCHSERDYWKSKPKDAELWFNAASDHLYELEIPDSLPIRLKQRLKKLCRKSIHWGHGFDVKDKPTEENKIWAISEAKDLLRLIDKHFGIKTQKGAWQ